MSRNLFNGQIDDNLNGFPISSDPPPMDGEVLVFQSGEFIYSPFSALGINTVSSVGTGQSIIKSLISGTLSLKSIFGDENITISASTNEVVVNLKPQLSLIQSITNDPNTDLNLNISDGGSADLRKLKINTKFGALETEALSLNNQSVLDINTITHLNSVVDGTPVSNKFLSLDNNNKIILSTTPGNDITATNFPNPSQGWFFQKVGNVLEFRGYAAGQNINIGTLSGNVLFSVDNPMQELLGINPNPPRSFNAPVFNPNNQYFYLGSSDIYFENLDILNQDKFLGIESDGRIVKKNALESAGSVGVGEHTYLDTVAGNARFRSFDSDGTLNITSTLETSYFGINPVQNTITDLSQNGSSLYLNSSNLHAPNMGTITPVNVLGIDSLNKIGKTTAIVSVGNAGFGASVISTVSPTALTLRTFTSNDNSIIYGGNVSTNDLSLNPAQTSITSLSSAGNSLAINASNITVPNISLNNSPTFDLGLNALGQIVKSNLAPGGINIYNSDGALNASTRTINGLNPVITGSENSLQLSGINLNLVNNPAYSELNTSKINNRVVNDWILSGDSFYTRAIVSPYNITSQKYTVNVAALYGNWTDICKYDFGSTTCLNFQIDVIETTSINNQSFSAKYTLNANYNSLIFGQLYSIMPDNIVNATTVGQNIANLEFYLGTNSITFRLYQASRNGSATTYNVFIRDNGNKDLTVLQQFGTGNAFPQQDYYNYSSLEQKGLGLCPNILFNFKTICRNFRIDFYQQMNCDADNRVAQLNIFLNGSIIEIIQLYCRWKNVQIYAHCNKVFNWNQLMNNNLININSTNTFSFTITGVNAGSFDPTTLNPYAFNLTFV